MKGFCLTILMGTVSCLPAIASATDAAASTAGMQSTKATDNKIPKRTAESGEKSSNAYQQCGKGYVVGIWPSMNGANGWGFWLSPTGPNWSNKDTSFYMANGQATTDSDSGKIIFGLVQQAMQTGQMVEADYWTGSGSCPTTSNPVQATLFQSVQVWYP